MKLKSLRVAMLENADGAVLMDDFNKLCRGQAVASSGTFAAGFVTEKNLVSVLMDGDRIAVFYTE